MVPKLRHENLVQMHGKGVEAGESIGLSLCERFKTIGPLLSYVGNLLYRSASSEKVSQGYKLWRPLNSLIEGQFRALQPGLLSVHLFSVFLTF
jgi:hypothetical protein